MQRRQAGVVRGAAAVIVCALMVPGIASCGSGAEERTVAGFCKTYHDEKQQFQAKYAPLAKPVDPHDPQATSKVLLGLMMAVQSLGDAKVILTKLDKAAPKEIEPDMAEVLDSWKNMQSTMGDEASHVFNPKALLGDLAKGMIMSLQSNGAWTRVGNYISTNCAPA